MIPTCLDKVSGDLTTVDVPGPRRHRDSAARRWFLMGLAVAALWLMAGTSALVAQARTKVNATDGLTYSWIPPGTFQMGCSPDDADCQPEEMGCDFGAVDRTCQPKARSHTVTLTKGFWISQTLVTQAAFDKVVGGNPSHFRGATLPVEGVSWDDAQEYCKGTAMRLPTEAEWEYAARGGSPAARYAPLLRIAWYGANSNGTTHPVGQKEPNAYGLYDMLGNVWEWVADWFGPYPAGPSVDPKGPPTGQVRVIRGGAAFAPNPSWIRASRRLVGRPQEHTTIGVIGFRCAGN